MYQSYHMPVMIVVLLRQFSSSSMFRGAKEQDGARYDSEEINAASDVVTMLCFCFCERNLLLNGVKHFSPFSNSECTRPVSACFDLLIGILEIDHLQTSPNP